MNCNFDGEEGHPGEVVNNHGDTAMVYGKEDSVVDVFVVENGDASAIGFVVVVAGIRDAQMFPADFRKLFVSAGVVHVE